MDWLAPIIAASAALAGSVLGHLLAQRSTKQQWERDEALRHLEWQRADARRWDADRIAAYSVLWAKNLEMAKAFGELADYWVQNEEPPEEIAQAFDQRRSDAAMAYARASLVASAPVRTALGPVWDKMLEISSAFVDDPDGTTTADELVTRLALELGEVSHTFDIAVQAELGVDTGPPAPTDQPAPRPEAPMTPGSVAGTE